MKTLFTVLVSILTLLTIQGQNPTFDTNRLSEINKWIENDVENGEIQVAIIMIADKDNILFSYVGSVTDIKTKKLLQKNDYFKIASMTKVITTVAVLQLYEKG